MVLIKFTFNVWENEIVLLLFEVNGTEWPGFDSK